MFCSYCGFFCIVFFFANKIINVVNVFNIDKSLVNYGVKK